MKDILFIFGTRPEAIKMAPLIKIFSSDNFFNTSVLVTAQHREMLDQVLDVFNIIPDYDLNIMSKNQTLESITSGILNGVSNIIKKIKPELIFVQGDTTTTFASALSAFYNQIPVVHVEAGLRTGKKYSPFPEEVNRKMTSNIASYHLCPTKKAKANLLNEGILKSDIFVTGNTVIDALLLISKAIDLEIKKYELSFFSNFKIKFEEKISILVTCHRRESFGKRLESICKALKKISKNENVQIIFPVHLNPNVQKPVYKILGSMKNVFLIEPQNYVPFIFLMKKSYIILTDSGGIQEEAPSLGKPVLVMRDSTERHEGITAGTAKLVGSDEKIIVSQVEKLLKNNAYYSKVASKSNPYGNGDSSKIIYNIVKKII